MCSSRTSIPRIISVVAEILSRFTKIPVAEVVGGMQVERDHIYVIPPNKSMGIAGGKFALFERDAMHSPHLSIDYFFTSWYLLRVRPYKT
jgi:two-component system, chemotaxis family, CheB/CheR fusion protein